MNPAVGISALVGLSIHTFFDGVSIASGFLVSVPLGPAHLLRGDPAQDPRGRHGGLHRAGLRARASAARCWRVLRPGGGDAGRRAGHAPLRGRRPYALPISTGVTLYVAATDLMPEVNEERGIRMALVVFLGVALFSADGAWRSTLGLP